MYVGAQQYVAEKDRNIFLRNCLEKHAEPPMIVENRAALISAGHSKNRKSLNNPLVSHPNVTKKSKEKRIDKLDIID